jgi:thiamine-phosphate pyrophosphorylase
VPIRVVVITDRTLVPAEAMVARIAAMLASAPRGSVLIQIREKGLDGGPLVALARAVLEVARPAGAPVWINDRVDVALVTGADGVHLPENGLSIADAQAATTAVGRVIAQGPKAARAIGGPFAIGCSRHTTADVLHAADAGAVLVQYGPVWSVPNKGEPIGLEALRIRLPVPLVAVGGIDGPARARHAALAGADAVAVIRAAWNGDPSIVGKIVAAVEAGIAAR